MSDIVLVDTSVLLNVYDVPGRNQHREAVIDRMQQLVDANDHLFIPMAAVFEAGNHIAHIPSGQERRAAAERFVAGVRSALNDEAPWKPISFPSREEVFDWLDGFPNLAMQGVGKGDLSIIKEWEACCRRYRMSRVWIWSLDGHLQAYDRVP
jgi:hypothetical protein